jgi:hypothetical protein
MLTREEKQEIIRDFALRHDGIYHPAAFVDEVAEAGDDHPAFQWFEWDNDIAARHHRVWQARMFAVGLKVQWTPIEDISGKKPKVHWTPFAVSPVDDRDAGGGYYIADPDNPAHMRELCRQAVTDLERWLNRYESSLIYAGGSPAWLNRTLKQLRSVEEMEEV